MSTASASSFDPLGAEGGFVDLSIEGRGLLVEFADPLSDQEQISVYRTNARENIYFMSVQIRRKIPDQLSKFGI